MCALTAKKHHDDAEGLLEIGVGGHVAEADGGERAHRVVERRDVCRLLAMARQVVGVIGLVRRVEAVLLRHSVEYGQPAIVELHIHIYTCLKNIVEKCQIQSTNMLTRLDSGPRAS